MGYRFLPARNRKFESISLQRRVLANLTRSIRSPDFLLSELRATMPAKELGMGRGLDFLS
jgi:hypothetical protein